MRDYLPAPVVARKLGIKTATLAQWRRLGKGPKGWVHLDPTHVLYPAEEVDAWEREMGARTFVTTPPTPPQRRRSAAA